MGRGSQELNIVHDKQGSNTMADARSMAVQRRLISVGLFATCLPFVIIWSYIIYVNPAIPKEASTFFEGQPTSDSPIQHTNSVKEDPSSYSKLNDTNPQPTIHSQPDKTANIYPKDDDVKSKTTFNHVSTEEDEQDNIKKAESPKAKEGNNLPATTNLSAWGDQHTLVNISKDSSTKNKTDTEVTDPNRIQDNPSKIEEKETSGKNIKVNQTIIRGENGNESSNYSKDAEAHSENPDGKNVTAQIAENTDVLVMESETTLIKEKAKTLAAAGTCDLFSGSWVPDTRPPAYTNTTCRYIQGHQDCVKNGRPDLDFLHWKWKPNECELPRINKTALLMSMRNKSMAFLGDSIARNQFQSLLCLLTQVEIPERTYHTDDDQNNAYLFKSTNFTIAHYWSAYLVRVVAKKLVFPDNSTQDVAHIYLDELDEAWAKYAPGIDVLQVSTGQWWLKRGLFFKQGKAIGGHICDGWKGCDKQIGFPDPYRAAIHNILRSTLTIPGYEGITILRTFSPDHFEGGRWDTGGRCLRTSPGNSTIGDITRMMVGIQLDEYQNFTGEHDPSTASRIKLLHITDIAQLRPDGHPDAYRYFQPFSNQLKKHAESDCLHWCLPGPIDTWNDLLVESLRGVFFR